MDCLWCTAVAARAQGVNLSLAWGMWYYGLAGDIIGACVVILLHCYRSCGSTPISSIVHYEWYVRVRPVQTPILTEITSLV
jgi:hypothetical protein